MECTNICDDDRTTILEWIHAMDDTDRILLLNKYMKQTEDIYCTFSPNENIDIIAKIHLFKFKKDALISSYVDGDPVVDFPGCKLNEFLETEMLNLSKF